MPGESLNLVFLPNVTEQSVTILALLDPNVEGQENFTVSLSMLMGGSGEMVMPGEDMATVVIVDQSESVPHTCILWSG